MRDSLSVLLCAFVFYADDVAGEDGATGAGETGLENESIEILPLLLSVGTGIFLAWAVTRMGDPAARPLPPPTVYRPPQRTERVVTSEGTQRHNYPPRQRRSCPNAREGEFNSHCAWVFAFSQS